MALDKNAGKNSGRMKWWEWFIPFWPAAKSGYYLAKELGSMASNSAKGQSNFDADHFTDTYNNHGLDASGNIEISPADPTSSAANVINYDPNKSAQENLLGYAQDNNSASAYSQYLANQYATEMSNSALSRAIADAESNGISKYQLFQSGNMAASTPSSGVSSYQSYENAMNRRESWNEKEMSAIITMITRIVTSTISSALGIIGK